MADTQRTRAAILSLFADNVTGQISAQDLRDFVVTIMETEFAYAGDFWKSPESRFITTDKSAKGDILYSQVMGSACSFMNVMYLTVSGEWMRANVSASANTGFLGLAMNSYAAAESQAQILLRGIVYDSSFSAVFSDHIGHPVYLDSGVPGSISVGITSNSVLVVGWIMHSDDGGTATGKWRFEPEWAIKGS